MTDESLEDGRPRVIDLEPSSPADPRAKLPFEQRQSETRTLANGTVLTTYTEPPLASEYSANLPDPDEYDAFLEEVMAEYDAEHGFEDIPQRTYLPVSRLRKEAQERAKAASEDPEGNPWERLDDAR